MKDDMIEEIRAVRHQISEEFGHNIQQYIAYLNSQQEQYAQQLELGRQVLKKSSATIPESAERLRQAA
jgi:hypothetical protein